MEYTVFIATLLALTALGYYLGRRRARATVGGRLSELHSLPSYYGYYIALWCGLPSLLVFLLWTVLEARILEAFIVGALPPELAPQSPEMLGLFLNDVRNIAEGGISAATPALQGAAEDYLRLKTTARAGLVGAALALGIAGFGFAWRRIAPGFRARNRVEQAVRLFLLAASTVSILTTIGIILSVLFETIRFFSIVPVAEFLFGIEWSPQTAIREDQVGSSGAFGAIPLFTGTLLITVIAMAFAVPIGLFAAIYMAEYAKPWVRDIAKPLLELLAGIPTVVYGFFAALTVAPALREAGSVLGLDVASESALAAGGVMGIMIIPFISSLSDDVITAVPQSLREGSLALGATKSETIRRVVLPAALPGIVAAVLLAVSRAVGETMIVVMAAGLAANLTANPLEAVTTVTVQIVTLLVGDQEFDSAKTLAAFALGFVLFLATLALNVIALGVVRKYRERYD
ncbi:MAG: phosphate ABC transporter permease subunit PstC [Alphaproteobacteria bacterium]